MPSWIQRGIEGSQRLVSTAILLREATRSSRRWQTYAVRTGFTGLLLAALLLLIHATLQAAGTGLIDIAQLGLVGRWLFVGYAVVQMTLVATIAPLVTATAMREETEQNTLDLLLLTKLTPRQIVLGKVLSRIGLLLVMVLGSMPVLLLAVSMGGVSGLEVLALTVHSLTVALMGAALGGFFALFTRSTLVSTMAALCYGIPFYALVPAGFALALNDPGAAAMFSPLSVAAASRLTALVVPLSYLPSLLIVLKLLVDTFALRASGASFQEAYSHTLWRTRAWGIASALWLVLLMPGVFLWPMALLDDRPNASLASVVLGKAAGTWMWAMTTWGYALATWLYLRVSFDLVDAVDGLFGRRGRVTPAVDVHVGTHPVWWRETRHGTITLGPVLGTWGLVMLALLQTGWWLVPGGLLALGVANAIATLMLTAWLGTRAFTEERRNHTLEGLITTTIGDGRIVLDKLASVLWTTFPLWLATGPMLAFGVPHLHMLRLLQDEGTFGWSHVFAGGFAWLWSLPVWVAVAGASLTMGLVARRARSAFGLVLAATAVLLGPAALVGQLFPDLAVLAPAARFWAPGLTGHAHLGHYAVSGTLWTVLAVLFPVLLARRLRTWVLRVLGLLAALGLATADAAAQDAPSDLEALHQLELDARPWLDGHVRQGAWTAAIVELRNTGAPTTGQLTLSDQLPGDQPATWVRTIELPGGATKRVLLPFVVGRGRKRTVQFAGADGRIALDEIELSPLAASDVLIAVIGDDALGLPAALRTATEEPLPRHGLDTLPEPPPVTAETPPEGGPRAVRSTTLAPRDVPTSSQVLSGVDWIVWPDADPSRLDAAQAEALAAWVVDGGHLLLTVTETARQLEASPLADLLPGRIASPKLDGIDGFLQQVEARRPRTPEEPAEPFALPVLTPVAHFLPRTGTQVYAYTTSGQPLWVAAQRGTGSIHLLLADLRLDPLVGLDRSTLWRTLLWLPDDGPIGFGFPVPPEVGPAGAPWDAPEEADPFETRVRRLLADVPGLAPVPIGWLVLASVLYLLLIGPVDYFVLRWARRQPLTWITFPSVIVIFTGASFFALRSTKGSQAWLTRVELVDVHPDAKRWQGTSHVGVFSTRKTDLQVASGEADGVLTPLREAGYLPTPALTAGYGGGSIGYRAETWTMAYMKTEWVRPTDGELRLTPLPEGRLQVENRLGIDLDGLVLYDGTRPVADFGAVADGALATAKKGNAEPLPVYGTGVDWRHRPHRGSLPEQGYRLVGHTDAAVDAIALDGLSPVFRTDVVVRQAVPVDAVRLAPPEVP